MTEIKNDNVKTVVEEVGAIKNGPLPLQLYMDICAKCGTCASVCPVYYGSQEKTLNPAERSTTVGV